MATSELTGTVTLVRGSAPDTNLGRFGMRKGLLMVLVALASTAALVVAHTASGASDIVGHLYVNDNTGGVNTIAGFDRHADGTLTPIPGSPFVAGGVGTGKGIASQGALQLSSDGRYLL